MKITLSLIVVFLLQLFAEASVAQDLSYERETSRFTLDTGSEFAFVKRKGLRNLWGVGFVTGMRYGLAESFAVGISLHHTVTRETSNFGSLYSGFASELFYAFSGRFVAKKEVLKLNGRTYFEKKDIPQGRWSMGLGYEQSFFNISNQYVSAVGVTGSLQREFALWDTFWFLKLKSGVMLINKSLSVPLILNLGMCWSFE